ncbi:MAG: GPP34 family phosphoprotein [Kineosporiaceae bacterium]|nr:GPP34 family phosphoprotein [Aeromicrobium sp.]
MTIAEDFLLLVTDPANGKCRLRTMATDTALGSANLVDLANAQRVELTGQKKKAKVVLIDKTPLGNPVLDRAIWMLQSKGPMRLQEAVRQLGKQSKAPLYEALSARGMVQRRTEKRLGLFTVIRWPVVDAVRRDNLIRLIQASLLHSMDTDDETGPLIGLLAASDSLRVVVDKPEIKAAKARAKVIPKIWPILHLIS